MSIQGKVSRSAVKGVARECRTLLRQAERELAGSLGKDAVELSGPGSLLRALRGIKLDARGFRHLAATVETEAEVSRVNAIATFVRERRWMNPDLVTIEGFRAALPAGRNPAAVELESALHKVDFRFYREYRIARDWIDDAHSWEFISHNASPGDEGASYWLRNATGETYMAKVPPDPRRGINERLGYGIHEALGVPTNQVQYGQRDLKPLLTLHKRIEGEPVTLNRVAQDIGLDKADYRIGGWPYPAENIGTGPSTWGREAAEAYQAKIAPRLEDPAIFDKLGFVGRINDDPDLKPFNLLATIVRKNADGSPVYRIWRIDFGIMHDGIALRNLPEDLALFEAYLVSLGREVNETHLRNILGTMRQFASLGDDHLTRELIGDVARNSDGSHALHLDASYQWQMTRRLLLKRDMVRAWLERHADSIARLGA